MSKQINKSTKEAWENSVEVYYRRIDDKPKVIAKPVNLETVNICRRHGDLLFLSEQEKRKYIHLTIYNLKTGRQYMRRIEK